MLSTINNAHRIVIKIGTSTIIDNSGALRTDWLNSLVKNIKNLIDSNKEVIIVTSGAVGIGLKHLNVDSKSIKMPEKQAAAAIGMPYLLQYYQQIFSQFNLEIAQVLLTLEDSENRKRYLNARDTLLTLCKHKIIPIINENDAIATAEIKFGDNDRLSARVATMVSADLLIMFSDVDGLYDKNPHEYADAKHIALITEINESIYNIAKGPTSNVGTGGMKTKIDAANICMLGGCSMILTSSDGLPSLHDDKKYSLFSPNQDSLSARKAWLSSKLEAKGSIVINDGAKVAITNGSSILPIGVVKVSGDFIRGDALNVFDENNNKLGIGLSAFSYEEATKIIGKNSKIIAEILGYTSRDELIHRDNFVLF